MPYSIMLDAGHGGRDPGAVYQGRQEKDDTLRLTLAIGEILQNNGIDVEYTRTTDIYESPLQKAQEANAAGVEFFSYRFTAIRFRLTMLCQEWNLWCMICRESNMKWQKTSMHS